MAEKSDVRREQAIIWKTVTPTGSSRKVSSVFSLLGATWQLEMNRLSYRGYGLYLRRIGNSAPRTPFSVITSVQYTGPIQPGIDYRSHKLKFIEPVSNLCPCDAKNTFQLFLFEVGNREVTVVCVFTDIPGAVSGVQKETVEVTTQTDFDGILPQDTLPDDKLSSAESEQGALCVLSSLDSLSRDLSKLLEDEVIPDITLKCGDRTIAAHRAVLAARSTVFSAMFQSKMPESETGEVEIADLDADVLELFLKYLYTGRLLESSPEYLLNLYAAGEKYGATALMMACPEHLINNLTQENCFNSLLMAEDHGNQEFKNAIFNFILNHVEIIENDDWKTFTKENFALSYEVLQMIVKQKCLK